MELNDDQLSNSKEEKQEPSKYSIEMPLEKGIIAKIIKKIREIRKYSQTRLGRIIGVKRSQISKFERGDNNFTLGTIIKVMDALRTKVTLKVVLEKKKDAQIIQETLEEENSVVNENKSDLSNK